VDESCAAPFLIRSLSILCCQDPDYNSDCLLSSLCDLPTKAQLSGNNHHEAGLDAFAAGLLFARLARGRGIHPAQLRSLPQLVKKTQHAEAPEEDGHDRNILRQVLRRTEEKAAEESGERPEVDTMEARRGDGAEKAGSPLQKFAE
jgi:DNA polymerase III epsilon subunit-like protein